MDTLASSKLQMSENLSPLKIHDGNEPHLFEVDENQENNSLTQLKRQRLSECVQTAKMRNKAQQPCAYDHTVRCISASESPTNATNGTIQLKGTHHTNSNDTIKSNGFYHLENSRENVLVTPSDDCSILANLCDGQNEGYFDSMVSSDLSDADMKLAEEKEKCTNSINLNGNDQSCDRVIIRGHRRTRARSSDSIQAEFYQARKQQMRLQTQHDSHLFTNGSDDTYSHCDTVAFVAHDTTTRGKSLSPPKIGTSRKQTINANAYFSRLNQRHLARPFSILRRQKLISKAKQQARLSPPSPSPTAMAKTIPNIAKIEPTPKQEPEKPHEKEKQNQKDKDNEEKAHLSESEYSSLEDDDDIDETNDWMGTWGKHMKSPCFRTLRPYQKMNHIPGSFQIGRKDKIWRNLQAQMLRNGKKEFNFMPLTYILPQDAKRLKRLWKLFDQRKTKWIIKPPASARGTGIKVVSKWTQIPKQKPMIVQKYIDRPLLINGSKFDLRLYVLVTSLNPLRAYMHTDGLARFASVKYSDDVNTLSDRYMHLTNYSINKLSSNYTKNEDAESCSGHKWTLKTLWKYFSAQGINSDGLWAALRNLVLRTVLSGEHVINQMAKANVGSKYNTFELFGIDVILDSELKPWLLEVNISPSLHSSSPLDLFVKGPLVTALLNTVRFNVPPRFTISQQAELMTELGLQGHNLCYDRRLHVVNLSKSERLKHNQFTSKSIINRDQYLESILENLTPDDIRCLIASEDELNRCAPLERVCPTPNSHRYIKFTEKPRYYNRLLDAWEHRYCNKRDEGIKLLQKLCESRTHLIIPIPCAKLNVKKPADGDAKHIEPNSENEIDEVFDASLRAVPQKRMNFVDTIGSATKIIDDCKSPLPMPDDQLNEAAVIDQHDILVSSIA